MAFTLIDLIEKQTNKKILILLKWLALQCVSFMILLTLPVWFLVTLLTFKTTFAFTAWAHLMPSHTSLNCALMLWEYNWNQNQRKVAGSSWKLWKHCRNVDRIEHALVCFLWICRRDTSNTSMRSSVISTILLFLKPASHRKNKKTQNKRKHNTTRVRKNMIRVEKHLC